MSDNMDAPKCERHGYIECSKCGTVLDICAWLRQYSSSASEVMGPGLRNAIASAIEGKWLDEIPARNQS